MAADGGQSASALARYAFSPDELQVCEILLQLPSLIAKSDSAHGFPFSWGRKRKRSVLNSPSPSPLSPPPSSLPVSTAAVPPPCEADAPSSEKAKASSPNTPLSFSPSESDENIKLSKKKKVPLTKKAEWLKSVNELTESKTRLKDELENMRRNYDNLKAINTELRAMKQEMILGHKKEPIQPETGTSSSIAKPSQHDRVESAIVEAQQVHHCLPSIDDHNFQDPIGIPDLNIPLEELTHRNYSRLMAAQARQRRIQICRMKNSNADSKIQSSNPCR